jgi:hypothetical protein
MMVQVVLFEDVEQYVHAYAEGGGAQLALVSAYFALLGVCCPIASPEQAPMWRRTCAPTAHEAHQAGSQLQQIITPAGLATHDHRAAKESAEAEEAEAEAEAGGGLWTARPQSSYAEDTPEAVVGLVGALRAAVAEALEERAAASDGPAGLPSGGGGAQPLPDQGMVGGVSEQPLPVPRLHGSVLALLGVAASAEAEGELPLVLSGGAAGLPYDIATATATDTDDAQAGCSSVAGAAEPAGWAEFVRASFGLLCRHDPAAAAADNAGRSVAAPASAARHSVALRCAWLRFEFEHGHAPGRSAASAASGASASAADGPRALAQRLLQDQRWAARPELWVAFATAEAGRGHLREARQILDAVLCNPPPPPSPQQAEAAAAAGHDVGQPTTAHTPSRPSGSGRWRSTLGARRAAAELELQCGESRRALHILSSGLGASGEAYQSLRPPSRKSKGKSKSKRRRQQTPGDELPGPPLTATRLARVRQTYSALLPPPPPSSRGDGAGRQPGGGWGWVDPRCVHAVACLALLDLLTQGFGALSAVMDDALCRCGATSSSAAAAAAAAAPEPPGGAADHHTMADGDGELAAAAAATRHAQPAAHHSSSVLMLWPSHPPAAAAAAAAPVPARARFRSAVEALLSVYVQVGAASQSTQQWHLGGRCAAHICLRCAPSPRRRAVQYAFAHFVSRGGSGMAPRALRAIITRALAVVRASSASPASQPSQPAIHRTSPPVLGSSGKGAACQPGAACCARHIGRLVRRPRSMAAGWAHRAVSVRACCLRWRLQAPANPLFLSCLLVLAEPASRLATQTRGFFHAYCQPRRPDTPATIWLFAVHFEQAQLQATAAAQRSSQTHGSVRLNPPLSPPPVRVHRASCVSWSAVSLVITCHTWGEAGSTAGGVV